MRTKRYEVVFDQISRSLLSFQPNDLVQLSDLIDNCTELQQLSPVPALSTASFDKIIGLLGAMLKNQAPENGPALLTEALDLMAQVFHQASSDSSEEIAPYLVDAVTILNERLDPWGDEKSTQKVPEVPGGLVLPPPPDEKEKDAARNLAQEQHNSDVLAAFLHDARERLARAQSILLDMENRPSPELLNELFRIFHTIKGEAGFLSFQGLGALTHQLENLLDQVRQNKLSLDTGMVDCVLESLDEISTMVESIADTGSESPTLLPRLHARAHDIEARIRKYLIPLGELLTREGVLAPAQVQELLVKQQQSGYSKKIGELGVEAGLLTNEKISEVLVKQQRTGPSKTQQNQSGSDDDGLVSVKARQIHYLIDMIGELLISLNQLDESNRQVQASRKITKSLQVAAMKLGTVSVGTLFDTMKRTARDAARQSSKHFDLTMAGEDIEVDRNLIERLGEPLMHLVRNSVVHGIEADEEARIGAGKPPRGNVHLQAERKGHQIVISVSDDGQGLRLDRIKAKALEKGLVSEHELNGYNDEQLSDLIFLPGFSTAEKVDGLAGRGVGMDVVKTMVETLRGRIRLSNKPGKGVRIDLVFPINMAIIDGMVIGLAGRQFVVPVASIIESLELKPEHFHQVSSGMRIISLRGESLPVLDLSVFYSLPPVPEGARKLAIIVESSGKKYALLVHEVLAKRELVVKPLGALFKSVRGLAGGTILHGGHIGLVLDVDQIIRSD